jgi:enoyl-CoA hydratase/carnithine racemase
MTLSSIIFERFESVARITFNRPEVANALSQSMLDEIGDALDQAERDPTIRVVVVQGSGPVFSSGFDLKEQLASHPTGAADFQTIMRFWRFPKPTIAAVRGACLAGACELSLACDITIASEDAFFGEPELKFGAGIVVMILPWIVGPKIAKEIILMGNDRVTAERAREIGMVNRVVPVSELESTALNIARHIAVIDPNLVQQTKRAINRSIEIQGMPAALEDALNVDLVIEGEGSPDKIQFMEIARRQGLKEALLWRDARFAKYAK